VRDLLSNFLKGNKAMASNKNQKGFTLIELSIVLVLIGLIIGGVLKGQELIKSTRLKMTVSQWDAVKAAVNSFQDKYVAIPGDYDQAEKFIDAGLTNGDGNGIVGTAIDDDKFENALGSENQQAWDQLYASGFLASVDTTNHVLPAKVPSGNFFIMYGSLNDRTAHWLRLQSGNKITELDKDVLSPNEMNEIERKYDDSAFGTGSIQAGSASGTCDGDTLSDDDTCTAAFELF
jgi:prepilin-type N-terminal cleavage/methylation domain-containing protein